MHVLTFSYVIFSGIQEVTRQRWLDIPAWSSPDTWQPGPRYGGPSASPARVPTRSHSPAVAGRGLFLQLRALDQDLRRHAGPTGPASTHHPDCRAPPLPGRGPPLATGPWGAGPAAGAPCVQPANRACLTYPRGRGSSPPGPGLPAGVVVQRAHLLAGLQQVQDARGRAPAVLLHFGVAGGLGVRVDPKGALVRGVLAWLWGSGTGQNRAGRRDRATAPLVEKKKFLNI